MYNVETCAHEQCCCLNGQKHQRKTLARKTSPNSVMTFKQFRQNWIEINKLRLFLRHIRSFWTNFIHGILRRPQDTGVPWVPYEAKIIKDVKSIKFLIFSHNWIDYKNLRSIQKKTLFSQLWLRSSIAMLIFESFSF